MKGLIIHCGSSLNSNCLSIFNMRYFNFVYLFFLRNTRVLSLMVILLPGSALGQATDSVDDIETYRVLFRGDVSYLTALNVLDHVIIKEDNVLFKHKDSHFEPVKVSFRQAELPSQDQLNTLLSYTDFVIGVDLAGQGSLIGEMIALPDSVRQVIKQQPEWEQEKYGVTVRFWSHVSTDDVGNIIGEVFGVTLEGVQKQANWVDLEMSATNFEIIEQELEASEYVVDISMLD